MNGIQQGKEEEKEIWSWWFVMSKKGPQMGFSVEFSLSFDG
jgi:hypothetical protein